ncbi:hypothetical protein D3C81_376430 [compost metagenome]
MSVKALLLATLTLGANDPQVITTTNVLDDVEQCVPAMRQIAEHHNLKNNIHSQGKEYLKARKLTAQGTVVLSISCKELK